MRVRVQILTMLLSVRQVDDKYAAVVVDVLDELDLDMNKAIGIKEFTKHALAHPVRCSKIHSILF